MDLARGIREMLQLLNGRCVNLCYNNLMFNKKTKKCRLIKGDPIKHCNNPIRLRWYPPTIWDDLHESVYYCDQIAALAVLEFMMQKSPYYDKDEKVYQNNIRNQIRTIPLKAYPNQRAAWELLFTVTHGVLLEDGVDYLEIYLEEDGLTPADIIKSWDDDVDFKK